MAKVTGLGGIFFTCNDVAATKAWYHKHLGLAVDDYGCTFWQKPAAAGTQPSSQQWSPFAANTDYWDTNKQLFMINYKVDNIAALLNDLKTAGVIILGEPQSFEYGTFAWIQDCDGRKVELWQPANEHLFETN